MVGPAPPPRAAISAVVLLLLVGGFLAVQAARAQDESVYLNANQSAVLPGSNVTLYAYGTLERAELRRIDPIQFARDPATAVVNGTVLEVKPPTATATNFRPSETFTFTHVPAGLLALVAVKGGTVVAYDIVQSTRIGLVARHGAEHDLYWAVRLDTGEPIAGAEIHRGSVMEGRTDPDGLLRTSRKMGNAVLLSGGEVAVDGGGWGGPDAQGRIGITTDRPLYRPGQSVHVKLVSWAFEGGRFVAHPNESLQVRVSTYEHGREDQVASAVLSTNAFGSASLTVTLGADAAIGYYTIQATGGERSGYGSFQVEAYRLPKFRVEVSPNAGRMVVNESRELLVTAKTYYGEAMTRGTVAYEISGSRFYDCWRRCWDYSYYGGGVRSEPVKGTLQLGSDGTARIHAVPDQAGQYLVNVKVTAITGEVIEAAAAFDAHAAAVRVVLEPEGYFVATGKPAHVKVRLFDLQDHPMGGRVEVRLRNQTYNYADGTQRDDLVGSMTVEVRDGVGEWVHTFAQGGYYSLEATARDEKGRAAEAQRWLYVGQDGYGWYTTRAIEVIAESEDVALGDPIRVHVVARDPNPVLVVFEGNDPGDARLLRAGQSSVALTAGERHAPNVNVVALQVRPRTGAGQLADLQQDAARIDVSPHPKSLNVTVRPDKDRYADGDVARILIEVRDYQGQPVSAEVSLAMIDQALLDISGRGDAELFALFYPQRYSQGGTTSWGYGGYPYYDLVADAGVGRFDALHGAPGGAPSMTTSASTIAGKITPPSGVKVREYFPETALWSPHLRTGPDGRLRIEAALPDTLTTWHLSAEAITAEGQVGRGEAELLTSRSTVADLFAPRFLTQGDEATVQATFANYAGLFQDFRVLLNATGVEIVGDAYRTLTLGHGQTELVSFRVRAIDPGMAVITLYGWSGDPLNAGDAVRIRLPVKPHGVESIQSEGGVNEGHVTVTIPPDAVGRASRINVTLSPTVADALVDALPYLTGFPYGCVEQTLSRFLPDLAVVRAAKAFGLNQSAIDAELDEQVKAGLQRLYGFQHESGAWGWWENDPDNPYTSAYVVYGLAIARDAGFSIDHDALARGVEALAKMNELSPSLDAYRSYALAVADPTRPVAVPSGSSPSQLALGALVAHMKGDDATARQKVDALRAAAVHTTDGYSWRESMQEWGDHGVSTETILTALALRAILAVSPDADEAHGAARWLLAHREGSSWSSTKDTAEAILSLVAYFEHIGTKAAAMDVNVRIDGVDHPVRFEAGQLLQAGRHVDVPVAPGPHTVDITRSGDSVLYWSVIARFWKSAEPITASGGDFRFTEQILGEDGRARTTLRAGDEATLRLTVTNVGTDKRYVQIESPLPAGFEVVKDNPRGPYWWYLYDCIWCGGWSAAEVRDDRVGFFAWQLPAGATYSYDVRVRAVFPGTYHVLPPAAEEMYDPTVRGHGDELRVTIEDAPGLQVGRILPEAGRVRANVHGVGDVGDVLTAWVTQGGSEIDRGSFARADGQPWTLELTAPADDYDLWLQARGITTSRHIDITPAPVAPVPRFNQTDETAWTLGPVVELVSGLAVAKAGTDYRAAFVNVPLDPVGTVSHSPLTAAEIAAPIVVGLAAIGAVGAGWKLYRRRR